MNDWYKPCSDGHYEPHWFATYDSTGQVIKEICPGGSPVTAADLETLTRMPSTEATTDREFAMLRELREAVGLFAGAMPISPKAAWEEAIAKVKAAADLEGLGERVWVCVDAVGPIYKAQPHDLKDGDDCGWRLLIPNPDPQPATEGT